MFSYPTRFKFVIVSHNYDFFKCFLTLKLQSTSLSYEPLKMNVPEKQEFIVLLTLLIPLLQSDWAQIGDFENSYF